MALVLAASGCSDGDDPAVAGSTGATGAGEGAGDMDPGGPDEPPPTSASASTSATAGEPSGEDETSGSSGSGGEEEGSDESGGSDTSGSDGDLGCADYCDIYMDACQDYSEYANGQHCLDHCAQWPLGAAVDTAGDSLGCRTYHVTVASSTDPNVHCPHSGPSGELTCVDADAPTCDLYCTRYFNNCTGDLNLWDDMDSCLGQCGLWYQGAVGDTVGHSVGCRAYYANLAAADAEANCADAGPGGGARCVLGSGG